MKILVFALLVFTACAMTPTISVTESASTTCVSTPVMHPIGTIVSQCPPPVPASTRVANYVATNYANATHNSSGCFAISTPAHGAGQQCYLDITWIHGPVTAFCNVFGDGWWECGVSTCDPAEDNCGG